MHPNRCCLLIVALSLLGLFALPCVAQSPEPPPEGMLYLGHGKVLEAARPRQMTLNANVIGFLYQPGGLSIAYSGVAQEGHTVTQYIRLVGLKRAESTTLTSETLPISSDGETAPHTLSALNGWSGDGRYLLIEQTRIAPSTENADGSRSPGRSSA